MTNTMSQSAGDDDLAADLEHDLPDAPDLDYDPAAVGAVLVKAEKLAAEGQLTGDARVALRAELRRLLSDVPDRLAAFSADLDGIG